MKKTGDFRQTLSPREVTQSSQTQKNLEKKIRLISEQVQYFSITLAMKGKCISMLCSSSSVLILISSNDPAAMSSWLTKEKNWLNQWESVCPTFSLHELLWSTIKSPIGVLYFEHAVRAQPWRQTWCEGPRMKIRWLKVQLLIQMSNFIRILSLKFTWVRDQLACKHGPQYFHNRHIQHAYMMEKKLNFQLKIIISWTTLTGLW